MPTPLFCAKSHCSVPLQQPTFDRAALGGVAPSAASDGGANIVLAVPSSVTTLFTTSSHGVKIVCHVESRDESTAASVLPSSCARPCTSSAMAAKVSHVASGKRGGYQK